MKFHALGIAMLLGTTSMAFADTTIQAPTLYGQLSEQTVKYNGNNFLGEDADATPYLQHAILGAKGLYQISDDLKLSYFLDADFAPVAAGDGTHSVYYSAVDNLKGADDNIFIRSGGFALISNYGMFAFGSYKSGIYSEFFAPVDVFSINTQQSTPSAVANGMRMWSQPMWTPDGAIYKSPVWHNLYTRFIYGSINNEEGASNDVKILQEVYKTKRFLFGGSVSLYDKHLTGVSDGQENRKRYVVASHYNWDHFHLAGVYEFNRGVGSAGADFDVFAVTGTLLMDSFDYSLSYQHRQAPDVSTSPITEQRAVIGQVKYHVSKHLDFYVEGGAYKTGGYNNLGGGIDIFF